MHGTSVKVENWRSAGKLRQECGAARLHIERTEEKVNKGHARPKRDLETTDYGPLFAEVAGLTEDEQGHYQRGMLRDGR